jgi:TonB family protein
LAYDLGGGSRTSSSPTKSNHRKLPLLLLCLALASFPMALAQSDEPSGRTVIRTQQPDYPETLKTKGIGGKVRLRARVLANGTVAEVDVLGGNPILAESAAKAVMTWRYAPAASATNEIVTFNFKPR